MEFDMQNCLILEAETFKSKKGTTCGVVRWMQQDTSKLYRTMVFGEDASIVVGLVPGSLVMLRFAVQGSRRDDSIELYLVGVGD